MNYYICTECMSVFKTIIKKKNLKHCNRRLIVIPKDQYKYYLDREGKDESNNVS